MNTIKEAARRESKAADKTKHEQSTTEPETVKARVLAVLLTGRTLTHLDVWREFGSSRASQHIYKLRREGWPIITETQYVITTDHGRKAFIAFYSLPNDQLDKGA